MPVIPVIEDLRQEDLKFAVSLGCIEKPFGETELRMHLSWENTYLTCTKPWV